MMDTEIEEARDFWNGVAEDWRIQVGDEGDSNRRLNSDPVLWAFAGDVRGLEVLDAGCGTGYLTNRLSERGALVTGIDFSERMIAIAQDTTPAVDFRVDSCSEFRTIGDEHFDMVIANYVFMDTPDLHGAVQPRSKTGRGGGAGLLPSVFSGRRCHSFEGRRKIPLRLGLAILPRKEMHRPTLGTFHLGFHLVSSAPVRVLEGVHSGRVRRSGFRGAQNHRRPISSRQNGKTAEECQDPPLFGGVQAAEAVWVYVTRELYEPGAHTELSSRHPVTDDPISGSRFARLLGSRFSRLWGVGSGSPPLLPWGATSGRRPPPSFGGGRRCRSGGVRLSRATMPTSSLRRQPHREAP